jgi:hypothetical protein
MPPPKKPTDLFVVNGWYLELPGLVSPHFETLEGIQKNANKVELVDAGTNRKYKFGTQILDFGELTLTRTLQGSVDDDTIGILVDTMIETGVKVPCTAVKKHKGQVVFMVVFDGFNIHGFQHATWDVNGEEKLIVTYNATCDGLSFIKV